MVYYILGKSGCDFCVKAKNLLSDLQLEHVEYKIDTDSDCNDGGDVEFIQNLKEFFLHKTYPYIFKKDTDGFEFMGGYTDLKSVVDF
jgi:glutaredoxin